MNQIEYDWLWLYRFRRQYSTTQWEACNDGEGALPQIIEQKLKRQEEALSRIGSSIPSICWRLYEGTLFHAGTYVTQWMSVRWRRNKLFLSVSRSLNVFPLNSYLKTISSFPTLRSSHCMTLVRKRTNIYQPKWSKYTPYWRDISFVHNKEYIKSIWQGLLELRKYSIKIPKIPK